MDLFSHAGQDTIENQPLAERLRPRKLEEMLGQPKILGEKAPWRRLLESGQIPSLILWGPPGCGKTTFALLLAQKVNAEFLTVNAVETGAKALRELGEEGRMRRLQYQRKTLLFVDEIHRLNKGQQDVLLPSVEKGDLILVGATTENPSYEINSALLSRCRILVFERLGVSELQEMARRACARYGMDLENVLAPDALERLLEFSDGDGRRLLNFLQVILDLRLTMRTEAESVPTAAHEQTESDRPTAPDQTENGPGGASAPAIAPNHSETARATAQGQSEIGLAFESSSSEAGEGGVNWPLNAEQLAQIVDVPSLRYDKTADEHYDTISAFIKSVRGSDPDAAVYYLARMIKGGEDPVFIARRLVILASEDIGNADPRALTVAVSGLQAVELVGWPEAAITLAQVTTYMASAPKSNRSYVALHKAQELVDRYGTVPIPLALRSAKTAAMKGLGYGKGYRYSHEGEKGYLAQRFLPEQVGDVRIYEPTDHGFEKNIRQYLAWLKS